MTEITKNNILSENELEQISGGVNLKKALAIGLSTVAGIAIVLVGGHLWLTNYGPLHGYKSSK